MLQIPLVKCLEGFVVQRLHPADIRQIFGCRRRWNRVLMGDAVLRCVMAQPTGSGEAIPMMPIAPRTVGSRFATPAEVTTRGGIGAEIPRAGIG
ncbi:hypothetical protein LAUMK4_04114 [Mycobacterium persicum]|uniref:Uncharacterized protein n=1 Tax=Mycobacterium persicum TaxID=1487726 RepID=A0ABY6RMQ9_9MYCO|nr:hypothetical protein LAUMK15_04521 [Mycobacterium persicum]VAZ98145.1 hypothetical protein LAUMK4_04114 [Mycobacterium persicum]